MRRVLVPGLFLLVAAVTAQAQSTNLRLQLQGGSIWVPTAGVAEDRSMPLPVRVLANQSGSTLRGPVVLRSSLPAGVSLRGFQPAAGQAQRWTCAEAGGELTCTYADDLVNPVAAEVALQLGVDPGFDVPDTWSLDMVLRGESADIPHNGAACAGASSNTVSTCARRSLPVYQRRFVLEGVSHAAGAGGFDNAPLTAGGQGRLRASWRCEARPGEACPPDSGTLDAWFALPAGLHWRPNPSFPLPAGIACTKAPVDAAELVRCSADVLTSPWVVPLPIAVSADVPTPGVLYPEILFDTLHQPLTEDCLDAAPQPNCAVHPVPIQASAAALLSFRAEPVRVAATPAELRRGQRVRVDLRFGNNGGAAAAQALIQLRLPPEVGFVAATPGSGLVCSSSGSVAAGQAVTCTRAGAIAANSPTLQAAFEIEASAALPVPASVPVLLEISDATSASAARLDACAFSPGLGQCALLELTTAGSCGSRHAGDGIYCDSFESP